MKTWQVANEDRTCCQANGMKMLPLSKGHWKASAEEKAKVE